MQIPFLNLEWVEENELTVQTIGAHEELTPVLLVCSMFYRSNRTNHLQLAIQIANKTTSRAMEHFSESCCTEVVFVERFHKTRTRRHLPLI